MSIKNVAIAGATGNAGSAILKALADSKHFNITTLSRSGCNSSEFNNVKTVTVDYEDSSSLVAALKGQDAVVCALNPSAADQQRALLDASVSAGVKRFLPSEFGSDTLNPHAAKLPVFAAKKGAEKYIEELAAEGRISYTYVISGPFLDFGLKKGFLGIDLNKRQVRYLDDGNAKFSTSTRETVGKAVVGVLLKPEETKDRAVYVQDAAVSLRKLLDLSKQVLGDEGWTEVDAGSSAEMEKASWDKLKSGQKDMMVFLGFLLAAMFREGYGGKFEALDNDLLGVKQMDEQQIQELIKEEANAQ